ncbi:MAG: IS21 family transposase [Actinomycetota bacterium]|nr:IS21 family transposase [Actinomycetota bacterium]
MDLREVLRHLQTTTNLSAIQRATGLNRRTLMRYRAWATEQGLLTGPLPPLEDLQRLAARTLAPPSPPQTVSTVEPYRDLVVALHARGVEGTAIWQRLGERGHTGSLSSIYRFLHQLAPPVPDVTVRVERAPGTEAQVDFGYAGYLLDDATGQRRKAWAFVMTLAYSRHQYVEFVYDQTLPTWIALHRHAFTFFGGVPQRLVLDNLKAGIARACFDDPQIQTTYRECAEHYGFLLAPCAPRTPEHKGKVEQGGVHYVKRNFLGGRAPTTLSQANADVRVWCQTTAGRRRHGTIKEAPLDRFTAVEQAQLLPLPATPYDLAVWKQVTLHRDCHVVFEQAFYSAPFRLVGQRLWVRGGSQEVRLYTADYQLVATHPRAPRPGERQTHPDHLPQAKLPQLLWSRELCQAMAAEVGPATTAITQHLLADRVVDRHRRVVRILRLREAVGDTRLEAACARALRYDDPTYVTIKRILDQGLEAEAWEPSPTPAPARAFVRTAAELLGHVFGGLTWNSSIN